MDTYLEIAQTVIRTQKRPLTPRAILAIAYRSGIVSHHLYGKTQHKTLGARLSEDIVHREEHSAFFRPEPGKYFLREFLDDASIPESYRRPIPTRRRFRELSRGPALALSRSVLESSVSSDKPIDPEIIFALLSDNNYLYGNPRDKDADVVFFRAFVCVVRDAKVLSYRLGRYREDRDSFMQKRCIGFATLVHDYEHTLFNRETFGIIDSGIRATKVDLEIPSLPNDLNDDKINAKLSHFLWASDQNGGDLLAVICFTCPPWFEPTKRRLALNDLIWLDEPWAINNVEDFDPWSQKVLKSALKTELCRGGQRERSAKGHPRQSRNRLSAIPDRLGG